MKNNEDKTKREQAELRNNADNTIFTAEKLFKDNEDLYEKVVVGANSQRQIIDSRALSLEAFQDIEDTEQLEEFDDIDKKVFWLGFWRFCFFMPEEHHTLSGKKAG